MLVRHARLLLVEQVQYTPGCLRTTSYWVAAKEFKVGCNDMGV